MQKYQQYNCLECSAHFKIKHEQDDVYYEVNFCPFCGREIWEEESEETEQSDEDGFEDE